MIFCWSRRFGCVTSNDKFEMDVVCAARHESEKDVIVSTLSFLDDAHFSPNGLLHIGSLSRDTCVERSQKSHRTMPGCTHSHCRHQIARHIYVLLSQLLCRYSGRSPAVYAPYFLVG